MLGECTYKRALKETIYIRDKFRGSVGDNPEDGPKAFAEEPRVNISTCHNWGGYNSCIMPRTQARAC